MQDKLTKLMPVLDKQVEDTVKALKSLTDGLDKLKEGADKLTDSFTKLTKSATAINKEYEKQATAMAAHSTAQVAATAELQKAAAPGIFSKVAAGLGWLADKALAPFRSAKKAMPAADMPAAAEAAAKPSRWARTKEMLGDAHEKLSTKLSPHLTKAKAALGEAEDKGVVDTFSAPLEVFNSLKDMPGLSRDATSSLAALTATSDALKASFAMGVSPALQVAADMIRLLMTLVQPLTAFMIEHTGIIRFLAITLIPLAGVLFAVAKAIQLVAFVTEVWGAAQAIFNVIMLANPFVLMAAAIVAIGAAGYYAYKHFEGFTVVIDAIINGFKSFINYVSQAIGKVGELFGMGDKTTRLIPEVMPQMDASGKSLDLMPKDSTGLSFPSLGFPNLNFGLSPTRGSGPVPPQASNVHFTIGSLGTTTFNVESLDKKHALAMRDHVHEVLVAALQDATAPSPALA